MQPTSIRRSSPVHLLAVFASSISATTLTFACESNTESPTPPPISLGGEDGGFIDVADPDGSKVLVDGGFAGPDGTALRVDRFVTKVVSFTPGPCAGFGSTEMPDIVLGPPVGAGNLKGSLDVVSLGIGGEIVLSFEPNAIVDGPGPDFIVFENAFFAAGDTSQPSADLGEVSVSEDGVTWKDYPCTPGNAAPYGACAGWHPVYSAPGNEISPIDPERSGGEAYDLSTVGLTTARFVRIRDKASGTCDGPRPKPNNSGFDLDAVAIIHAMMP